MTLEGKLALVTGAGSGLGKETAIALAREGARVLATDIDEASVTHTATACNGVGSGAFATRCDVADSSSVRKAFECLDRELSGIDILVNNAG
ncbi:MAG: SDR family NAD(P)-dependent oxidoreductase, partial [Myxococcales bacterium]